MFLKSRPYGSSGNAVILNDTSDSYHWGCYATSMMISSSAIHAGYAIRTFDVETTHGQTGEAPAVISEESLQKYITQIGSINPYMLRALKASDIVIVNGEGTLHRFHNGPRALLSIMCIASTVLKKRVHLINHGCFPSGDVGVADPSIENFYRACLEALDRIVVRDPFSAEAYKRWSIPYVIGSDCLPLYCHNHLRRPSRKEKFIALSATSFWSEETAEIVATKIRAACRSEDLPFVFLSGGHRREPPEDIIHFRAFQKIFPKLELIRPPTLESWIEQIASAKLLITGRYHHLMAAAWTGTPSISFKGNTPKCDALANAIGFATPLSPDQDALAERIREEVKNPSASNRATQSKLVKAARNNFSLELGKGATGGLSALCGFGRG